MWFYYCWVTHIQQAFYPERLEFFWRDLFAWSVSGDLREVGNCCCKVHSFVPGKASNPLGLWCPLTLSLSTNHVTNTSRTLNFQLLVLDRAKRGPYETLGCTTSWRRKNRPPHTCEAEEKGPGGFPYPTMHCATKLRGVEWGVRSNTL